MKHPLRKAAIVGSVFLLAGTAMAGDIYKYVDENGNVHYVDRPTGDANEQRLALVSRNTNSATVSARVEERRERFTAHEEERKAREKEEREEAEKARTEAEERAAKCQENQSRLRSYGEARRLYKTDENGERVYLDDAERSAAEDHVREQIAEYCN